MGFEVTAAVDTWSGRRDSEGFEVRDAADARSGRRNPNGFEVRAAADTRSGPRKSKGCPVTKPSSANPLSPALPKPDRPGSVN